MDNCCVSEMGSSYKDKGVFLHTVNLDSAFMVCCLQKLLEYYPFLRFTSIVVDEKLSGFRVHFASRYVDSVLEKSNLIIKGERVRICPLTTVLTVHGVGIEEDPALEDDVIKLINEGFGKVSEVIKFSSDGPLDEDLKETYKKHPNVTPKPDSLQKNWRVRINVPEFDENIFTLAPNIVLTVPNWDRFVKVSFRCSRCKKRGHLRHNCSEKLRSECESESARVSNHRTETSYDNPVQGAKNSRGASDRAENASPDGYTEDEEDHRQAKRSRHSSGQSEKSEEGKRRRSLGCLDEKYMPMLKIVKLESTVEAQEYKSDIIRNIKFEVSDNSDHETDTYPEDDDQQDSPHKKDLLIDNASNDSENKTKTPSKQRLLSDELDLGEKTQDAISGENSNDALAVTKEREGDVSSLSSGQSTSVSLTPNPALGAADTSILSSELQGYINYACESVGVLDRQKLDAFLGYVKKKNKPSETAVKYTPNVKGLKQQLQAILDMRYHNRPTNTTKEDSYFIKWLEGLVSRFDRTTPSKRKRN